MLALQVDCADCIRHIKSPLYSVMDIYNLQVRVFSATASFGLCSVVITILHEPYNLARTHTCTMQICSYAYVRFHF